MTEKTDGRKKMAMTKTPPEKMASRPLRDRKRIGILFFGIQSISLVSFPPSKS